MDMVTETQERETRGMERTRLEMEDDVRRTIRKACVEGGRSFAWTDDDVFHAAKREMENIAYLRIYGHSLGDVPCSHSVPPGNPERCTLDHAHAEPHGADGMHDHWAGGALVEGREEH